MKYEEVIRRIKKTIKFAKSIKIITSHLKNINILFITTKANAKAKDSPCLLILLQS